MDIWTVITQNIWQIAIMLVAVTIPVLFCLFVLRRISSATKKTVRYIRK